MLTDLQIKSAKAAIKDYKLSDGKGLHLLVRTNGSKLWQLRYWINSKERKASLGKYPEITLQEARERRQELRRLVAQDRDPVEQKRLLEAQNRSRNLTFQAVALQWLGVWSRAKSVRHVGYVTRRLESGVFPVIGGRLINEIRSPEVVAMVRGISEGGAVDVARRVYQTTSQVFRFAVANGYCETNPAAHIRPGDILPGKSKKNYARIDGKDLPDLLRRINAYSGTPITRLAMQLLARTFVRTSELIQARWDEFDLNAAEWRIPAERMKMRKIHVVPLSPQVIEILKTLKTVSGHRENLFPSQTDRKKTMSNNTILRALDRMGYKGRMTGHGFRGLASTILHEHEFDHQHIETQLAHQEKNQVSASYNGAQYLRQRAEMMQWWSNYLDNLLKPKVVSMRA